MGESNGSLNAPTAMNGIKSSVAPSGINLTSDVRSRPGFFSRLFGLTARILTWYSILTILFRCPATLDACDDKSPYVCYPYFRVKHTVAPHLEPYYDTYAAPYVEVARPYYDTFDRTVLTPTWGYATAYGAPRVAKVQAYSKEQWEKNVQPQLSTYQDVVEAQYHQTLGPHVDRLSITLGPYYDAARTNALQTYYEILLPSYEFVQPYAQQGYRITSAFVTNTALPSAQWAWQKTYVFLDGTVWPQLRIVYVENVEPQLVKISQRLGRHNGKGSHSSHKPSSVPTTSSSFVKPAPSVSSVPTSSPSASSSTSSTSSISSSTSTSKEAPRSSSSSSPPTETTTELVRAGKGRLISIVDRLEAPPLKPGEEENEVRMNAHRIVIADLEDWQERYAKAAEEGAVEIEKRVEEVSRRIQDEDAKTKGKALLDDFQSSTASELAALKKELLSIISSAVKGESDSDKTHEDIIAAVRGAGVVIKGKAQEVRTWRENYEKGLRSSVSSAAQSSFAILDGIRDLALQKIGMKWAWTDGITYRDWAKFHELKSRFTQWHGDLEKLIVTHPDLEAAQLEGARIEDKAMESAQSAAKELARLKQVANWKLIAGDDSNEFNSELAKQAAETAEAARAAEEQAAAAEKARAEEERSTAEKIATETQESDESDESNAEDASSEPKTVPAASAAAPESPASEASESIETDTAEDNDEAPEAPDATASILSSETGSQAEGTFETSFSETPVHTSNTQVPDAEESESSTKSAESASASEEPSRSAEESPEQTPSLASEASSAIIAETPTIIAKATDGAQAGNENGSNYQSESSASESDAYETESPEPVFHETQSNPSETTIHSGQDTERWEPSAEETSGTATSADAAPEATDSASDHQKSDKDEL